MQRDSLGFTSFSGPLVQIRNFRLEIPERSTFTVQCTLFGVEFD